MKPIRILHHIRLNEERASIIGDIIIGAIATVSSMLLACTAHWAAALLCAASVGCAFWRIGRNLGATK